MYRRHFVALMALAPLARALPAVAQGGAAGDFARLSAAYLAGMARLHPGYATALGNHAHDGEVEDLSAAGRARDAAFLRATLDELGRIDRATLSRDDQVDAALLDNDLRYQLWTLEVLQPFAWDPQGANGTISGGLYALAARDFAPWPQRLRSATRRMEQVPAMYAQMRETIVPARVPAIFATTVAKQNSGILQIVDTMLSPHKDTLPRGDRARFDRAVATLRGAVAEQQRWLDTVLVPAAKGDFRLGTALYDQKLKFALVSPLSRGEIKTRATRAAADTRAEMYALARTVLHGRPTAPPTPARPTPAQQQKAIEAALEMTYARRPNRNQVMAKARATLATATAFVREKKLVRVPATPVEIIEMPKFQQGVAVAYCDSPGPLEKHLGTFYAVSPIPADWSDAQATSFLREYNDYMLHDLSIHEAMPGHYLQIAHSNENKSILRAVLSSGPFVEGWAVYAEGMMADADYLDGDPLFKLTVLKMRMRSITNALLDIGIHTEGLTEATAMDMMMRGAFQQEREAAGKWTRARLGSTQLPSYFVGYSEHIDLRRDAERRDGTKFDLMRYNDAVISHGSPPVRYVRALMFGEPIA
ncbi:DUF885 domain-containing protein [Sphingomonas sp. Leaf25]|uniref:DUF885 domain-containing protein n=1 Tax=Sphingomonas sp. Leaf25 TaxID=1735692 RepID=UPI0006F5E26C|nr:DUF885 domain-containing protein [Sphingomonas sp. Leaf25]KQM98834.1 hypothetical protein ASE78_06340 [Sphingomonas sp. Leaf25]